jgi:WD40 repeat protein
MKATKCRPFVDKIKGHREPIVAMLSPNGDNGQRLYSASTDGWLYVWDIPNKEITHKIQLSIPPTTTQLSFTCIELN